MIEINLTYHVIAEPELALSDRTGFWPDDVDSLLKTEISPILLLWTLFYCQAWNAQIQKQATNGYLCLKQMKFITWNYLGVKYTYDDKMFSKSFFLVVICDTMSFTWAMIVPKSEAAMRKRIIQKTCIKHTIKITCQCSTIKTKCSQWVHPLPIVWGRYIPCKTK